MRASRAVLLGLLQGPTELAPVSSSAHTILVPLLAGWGYERLEPPLRKSFEVALHGGGALGLVIGARHSLLGGMRRTLCTPRGALFMAASCAPAACAGLLWQGPIERRLSEPRSVLLALAGGGLAMALADGCACERDADEATLGDALAIGAAQAVALIPGVSRSGAALSAARMRRFRRDAAHTLAWRCALPLMLGASVLSAARALSAPQRRCAPAMLAAGACSALVSTLACVRLLCTRPGRAPRLLPFAAYRLALAALGARKLATGPGRRGRVEPRS